MVRQSRRVVVAMFVFAFVGCAPRLQPNGSAPLQPVSAEQAVVGHAFFVRSYGGKPDPATGRCLDVSPPRPGSGALVVIAPCNRGPTQQIVVQEINARHEVVLRAGAQVIGIHNPVVVNGGTLPAARPATAPAEFALELQAQANPIDPESRNQIFALDGDSIILASNRSLVAQVQNNRGANRSPVVVGPRALADAELWDFLAVDGGDRDPTSGFVRVSTRDALLNAIAQVNQVASNNGGAAWGSVIKVVDPGVPIDLSYDAFVLCPDNGPYRCSFDDVHNRFDVHNLLIPAGVTVRGDRRDLLPGPLIRGNYDCRPLNDHNPCELDNVFQIQGDFARVTGLRVQGPSNCLADPDGCHSTNLPAVIGVQVGSRTTVEPAGDIVDHNDVFDWPEAAVNVASNRDAADKCPDLLGPPPNFALVTRNFIHHNENNDGYGVGIYGGAGADIRGNTFLLNRHSISGGDGEAHEQYDAAFNLVLSRVPVYGSSREQDFDMHGTENPHHWYGGVAGSKVVIHSNTFLGGNRDNFDLRGEPCGGVQTRTTSPLDRFDFNVTMESSAVLIVRKDGTGQTVSFDGPAPTSAPFVSFHGNQLLSANPAGRLGVGDFDGDGQDDLFVATGAAWYYAPAARTEWRFLNAETDPIDHLLFGDFDADGRTDVFTQHGRDWLVSWGGASSWERINSSDPAIDDFAVGNFDNDPRADIFHADGKTWSMSSGGVGPFVPLDVSSFRVRDLRFGDFNNDGKTDVFGVTGGAWQVELGGATSWQRLNDKLTDSVAGLVVADFDGDHFADVGRLTCALVCLWQVSSGGKKPWVSFVWQTGPFAAAGLFAGTKSANVLGWENDRLDLSSPSAKLPLPYSRNEMR
jgi:hypothetical protein